LIPLIGSDDPGTVSIRHSGDRRLEGQPPTAMTLIRFESLE
jgi:hypothetical protein